MISARKRLAEARDDQLKLAGCGLFSQVLRIAETDIALKIPDEPGEADAVERRIYERLGVHPYILKTYGDGESVAGKGLILQFLPRGTLAKNLELDKFPVERANWPTQAAEAIKYIHSKGVIHCDVGAHNFMVQNDGSLVLADFCGSILDGSRAQVATSARYTRPMSLKERSLNQTQKDDIFALGTVLYEIGVGHQLYPGKSDGEIYQLFQDKEFPDTSGLTKSLSTAIEKCWRDQYTSADEVHSELANPDPLPNRPLLQCFGLSLGLLLVSIAVKSIGLSNTS